MKKRAQQPKKAKAERVSFRGLRVGDWICITAIASEFLQPGYCFQRETRQLYERLIRLRRRVKVSWIDDFGYPWITYRHRDAKGLWPWHCLMIDEHDLFVRVKTATRR